MKTGFFQERSRGLLRTLSRQLLAWTVAAATLLLPGVSQAIDLVGEDTDLFLTNPNISAEVPNVLIVLDNTSNWSAANQGWSSTEITGDSVCGPAGFVGTKQGNAELCAIYKVVANLTDTVNVGVMMINDQDGGGYVRFPMKSMNATNRAALQAIAKSIDNTGITDPVFKTSANTSMEHVLNDAFRYFNSLATYGGTGAASTLADVSAYGSSDKTNFSFSSPSTSSCGYDYIIFIGNGWPSGNESTSQLNTSLTAAATLLNDSANVTPNTTPSAAACQGGNCNNSDAWTRFMYTYGAKVAPGAYRHITTYTVDVCKDACDTNQAKSLSSMASLSYGKYYKATNLAAITTALTDIFTQVQAVNSVFAATTLPVSINVRGTNLNQVYIGVFRPDPSLSPRWMGNLKQYELGVANATTGQLQLIDATGTAAVNLNTGFIANTAKSYWTASSNYWGFRSPFKPTDAGGASDSPDGDLVEKGGAAERIRAVYPIPDSTGQVRSIYTCTGTCLATSGTSLSGTKFEDGNAAVSATLLGTYVTLTLDSLSASGQTATATINAGHTFAASDQVTIAGATPDMYNGTYAVASVSADSKSFTYSLSPNTPDTTHAYVTLNTLSSSGLTAGSDLITVSGASPNDYNVTDVAIAAVAGNSNQVSYALATSPTSAASGYTVSAKRLISNTANSTNLVWTSGVATGNVSVTRANHGYSAGNTVTISGVTNSSGVAQGALNGDFVITSADTNSFKYSASGTPTGGSVTTGVATISGGIPSGWGNGTIVTISGATSSNYNASGVSMTNVNAVAGTFTYTTSGAVSVNATAPGTVTRTIASDTSTWVVSAGASTGTGSNKKIRLTLSRGKYSGQLLRTLTTSDTLTIANCTYTLSTNVKGTTVSTTKSCAGLTISAISGNSGTTTTTVAADTYANISGTVTVDLNLASGDTPNDLSAVTVSTVAAGVAPTSASTTLAWTGSTTSSAVTLTSIVPGTFTVNAYGTVYASKAGDLAVPAGGTSNKVTSIVNQGTATGTITAGLASNADTTERAKLIAWVRGVDNKDTENQSYVYDSTTSTWSAGTASATDVRASAHGDVLHSRPAVINYNRNGDDNDVFVYYGANDGMFHAIKGGRSSNGGDEQWAFIPQEHFGKLKRLRNQTPTISSVNPREYFFDGPIGAYTKDANSNFKLGDTGDKVQLFVSMRRGGRYIYALDVSDPSDPKFLWRKGCPNKTGSSGCDAGYGELGQTWSEPKLGYVNAYGNARLVAFFAAGYDQPVEDLQPCGITSWSTTSVTGKTSVVFPNTMTAANCGANLTTGTVTTKTRSMGRGIYMVDAATGDVLWRAVSPNALAESVTDMTTQTVTGMDFSMAADLAVLKNRSNTGSRGSTGTESVQTGYLDRIYGVDTGGQVWRVDISDADVTKWAVSKLAAIASSSGTTSASMRKFLFSVDVVYSSEGTTNYDAVLVGSGDREHPFDQTVSNRFYMFKDRNPTSMTIAQAATVTAITESDLFDVTNNCLQTASTCDPGQTQTQAAADLLAAKGWKLRMSSNGEKTIAPATTSAGTVIFNTNEPKQDTITGTAVNVGPNAGNFCTSDLGTARQYGINYQTAVASNIYTALPVNFQNSSGRYATFAGGGFLPAPVPVVVSIGGKYYQTVISGVQSTNPGGLTLQTRVRTYWYKKTN